MPHPPLHEEVGRVAPFEVVEEEAFLNILRTASVLSGPVHELLRSHGLSAPLYNILRALRSAGPQGLRVQQLGERMVARVPDMTRLLDRLVQKELVARQRAPNDRRVVRTFLTEKGAALLALLDQPMIDLHRNLLGHLGPRHLLRLNELLVQARHPPQQLNPEEAAPTAYRQSEE